MKEDLIVMKGELEETGSVWVTLFQALSLLTSLSPPITLDHEVEDSYRQGTIIRGRQTTFAWSEFLDSHLKPAYYKGKVLQRRRKSEHEYECDQCD